MSRDPHALRRAKKIAEVSARDGDRCFYCGCPFGAGPRSLTLDHMLARSRGGTRAAANVRLACAKCNRRKAGADACDYESSRILAARRETIAGQQIVTVPGNPPRDAGHISSRVDGSRRP